MGVKFYNNNEKYLFKKFVDYGIVEKPIKGVNCFIRLGQKEIDFRLPDDLFIEYHPCPNICDKRTYEEYYNDRLNILKKYGFNKLIVIQNINEFEERILPLFKNEISE